MMTMMVFPFSNSGKEEEAVTAYTVERCGRCQAVKKREFAEGDVLFAESSACASCGGSAVMSIEKIFGQGGGAKKDRK